MSDFFHDFGRLPPNHTFALSFTDIPVSHYHSSGESDSGSGSGVPYNLAMGSDLNFDDGTLQASTSRPLEDTPYLPPDLSSGHNRDRIRPNFPQPHQEEWESPRGRGQGGTRGYGQGSSPRDIASPPGMNIDRSRTRREDMGHIAFGDFHGMESGTRDHPEYYRLRTHNYPSGDAVLSGSPESPSNVPSPSNTYPAASSPGSSSPPDVHRRRSDLSSIAPAANTYSSPFPDAGPALREQLGLGANDDITLQSLLDPPPGTKPMHSLPLLIKLAIYGSPRKMLTLQEIYAALENRFEWFRENSDDKAWKNSIRHNLSLNKVFRRQPRPISEPGKGNYWHLDMSGGEGYKRPRKRKNKSKTNKPEMDGESSPGDDDYSPSTDDSRVGLDLRRQGHQVGEGRVRSTSRRSSPYAQSVSSGYILSQGETMLHTNSGYVRLNSPSDSGSGSGSGSGSNLIASAITSGPNMFSPSSGSTYPYSQRPSLESTFAQPSLGQSSFGQPSFGQPSFLPSSFGQSPIVQPSPFFGQATHRRTGSSSSPSTSNPPRMFMSSLSTFSPMDSPVVSPPFRTAAQYDNNDPSTSQQQSGDQQQSRWGTGTIAGRRGVPQGGQQVADISSPDSGNIAYGSPPYWNDPTIWPDQSVHAEGQPPERTRSTPFRRGEAKSKQGS